VTTSPTVLRLATRLEQVGFSDIVKLRNRIMELRSQGATVYQFEGGEPFMPTPAPIKAAMKRALDQDQTRYAPSSGIPELREAIAEKLRARNRIPAESKDVIVVNGGMQALFGAFQSIVNPGDEVLVFSPYWTPIKRSRFTLPGPHRFRANRGSTRARFSTNTRTLRNRSNHARSITTLHKIRVALSSHRKKRKQLLSLCRTAISSSVADEAYEESGL
jgi:hypothetical protein